MSEQKHLPLSLVGELLIKPALRSLGIRFEATDATQDFLPRRESTHDSVEPIPIMADPDVLERVLERLRKL